MGHKVNPYVHRLGTVTDWKSKWFGGKDYAKYLYQDIKIRKSINERFKDGGVADVKIARTAGKTSITIFTSKPGVVVGRSGANVEELRISLERKFGRGFQVEVSEIRKPDLVSKLVGEHIAHQISDRMPYRSTVKQAISRVMESGAKGVKVTVSGRLGGAEIARTESFGQGRVPLQTIRSDIDFASIHAKASYGIVGVKVWIYKGDIFELGSASNVNK